MKNSLKYILQKLLGLKTYLYVFALFKIKTLRKDSKENDFFTFLSLLKDGAGDVLDIGANLGIMTVHLAKALPNTTIHAFEPVPANISTLKRISAKFNLKKTQIHEIALGEAPGKVKMILPLNGQTVMQGLSHVKHDSITEWNQGQEFEVILEKLDNVLNGQKIQGIKIDIENFEYFALKGATSILVENRPIIYAELWENENRSNCFDLLKQLNYSIYEVENGKLKPYDVSCSHSQNFIFIADK